MFIIFLTSSSLSSVLKSKSLLLSQFIIPSFILKHINIQTFNVIHALRTSTDCDISQYYNTNTIYYNTVIKIIIIKTDEIIVRSHIEIFQIFFNYIFSDINKMP